MAVLSRFTRALVAAWCVACLYVGTVVPSWAQAPAPVPALSSRLTDAAGVLGVSARQELEGKLAAFETATGGQLAVLLVKTAEPETIEQYALRVAEAWKIGKKGKDNGALLVIAMKEKKLRIEVGYGWEGALPDVEAKRIIREVITPFFKQSQFAQGIAAGIDKIQLAVAKENQAASSTVNDRGVWEQSHNATVADSTVESLASMAPVLLGILAVLSFVLPSLIVGGIAGVGTMLFTGSMPAAAAAGFAGFVIASILRGLFGAFRRAPLGGNRVYRNSDGWGGGGWTSGGGWSSGGGGGGSWGGGGGSFGGGGASGGWGDGDSGGGGDGGGSE
ncbi:MAG: TPM domain-containing protein [Burkholderiales bacterium]|nr:TPM domain-containing protein [Burkholderiales bacterium]